MYKTFDIKNPNYLQRRTNSYKYYHKVIPKYTVLNFRIVGFLESRDFRENRRTTRYFAAELSNRFIELVIELNLCTVI